MYSVSIQYLLSITYFIHSFLTTFCPLHPSIFKEIEHHQITALKTPGLFWDVLVSFLFLKQLESGSQMQ